MKLIIKIYDYLARHTKVLWGSMFLMLLLFLSSILNIKYSENIADFLPLGESEQEAMSVYQNISGADKMYILFDNPNDEEYTVEAINLFLDEVDKRDSLGWCMDLTAQVDMSQIQAVTNFIYENIPYFLTSDDFERIDSLMANPDHISNQLRRNKEMLMFPTSSMMVSNIVHDPLGLFGPVISALQGSNPQMGFEMYDGYIFTPDMSRAVAMVSSPFGNSETENNTKMLALLHEAIDVMGCSYPDVNARIVGGPEIAVGNSTRIKKDSILAISLSVVLIMLLVTYSIGSLRNILLIFLSIGWGWLFALAGMSLFSSNVSIIVIGISSVILGIAVNYPLHLIVHMSHTPNMRVAVKEILLPLVIGNITTVSAFMTLIPLQSAALRDLGLFASLLLVGTILFVLIYLPHFVKVKDGERKNKLLDKMAAYSPENNKKLVAGVAILTIFLSVFSFRTEFDSNMSNINYMTEEQREDMRYFQSLLSNSSSANTSSLYVLSSGDSFDKALGKNSLVVPIVDSLCREGDVLGYSGVSQFLVSKGEQSQRLESWRIFMSKYKEELTKDLRECSAQYGFSSEAFASFNLMMERSANFKPQDIEYFSVLTKFILSQNITRLDDLNRSYIVNVLSVETQKLEMVKSHFDNCFDMASTNSALSNNLSDNFNYIGWACSLIVFFFLWFSFGRLELAAISFLPMALSWIWILGIMALFGIKFNIVNVILATFIFGQGDDYTIFITEGCQHEYTYRKPILSSYKSSIIQSALIMFVGIGTLIVSKHPAMKSLAQVTIVGMFSVVLMSYMIPPLMFRWLTMKNGKVRQYPLTIKSILCGSPNDPVSQVKGRYIYKGKEIVRTVNKNLSTFVRINKGLNLEGKDSYSMEDNGYGEVALFIALAHPDVKIVARIDNDERRRIAEVSAQDFVDNIEFIK